MAAVSLALAAAERTITDHPERAARLEDFEYVREYHIRGTPFSLLYTVIPDQVLVIDVRDTRGQRSVEVLRKFLAGL
jgi:hypothetical protein